MALVALQRIRLLLGDDRRNPRRPHRPSHRRTPVARHEYTLRLPGDLCVFSIRLFPGHAPDKTGGRRNPQKLLQNRPPVGILEANRRQNQIVKI